MTGLIHFAPGESFLKNDESWEEKVLLDGKGMAEGIELLCLKEEGRWNGWIGIDISRSEREFKEIMDGRPFPFKYDRRFGGNLVLIWSLNERISFSTVWKYATGSPISLPVQKYDSFGEVVYVYSDINSYRMRDYHRLDLGVNFEKQTRLGKRTWNISIMNVYNRQNPYYYYFDYEYTPISTGTTGHVFTSKRSMKLYQQSLISFLPSGSYSFVFN